MSHNNNTSNLNPLLEEDSQHQANTIVIGPQPHGGTRTPPQRSNTDPYEANSREGYLLGNSNPTSNTTTPGRVTAATTDQNNNTGNSNQGNRFSAFPSTINTNNEQQQQEQHAFGVTTSSAVMSVPPPQQLDNKQIAELLRQQDPSFVRLVVPPAAATTEDMTNVADNKTQSLTTIHQNNINKHAAATSHNEAAAAIVYENPEQLQPTAEELKQQRKIERITRHYGEEARDRGQQVPLIKPRYGPWRRNKESIRVSTNLTLGQQHNTASELMTSGGSFGMRPEKMVVQCGIQHYVDELHFDTPYAMFRTKDGKIETRSVGWSKRGDFVVERHDLVLTSDYCYSSSDAKTQSDTEYRQRRRSTTQGNQQQERVFGVDKPRRLGETAPIGTQVNSNNKQQNEQQEQNQQQEQQNMLPFRTRRPVLQVAHSKFESPLCMDPSAPKPREVVSEGELRQASRNLWRRKYPGVKCPKNRKVRNRLMNDYFVNEHTRPVQLFHAQSQNNKKREGNNNNNNDGISINSDDDDDDEDDMLLDDFQYQMANHHTRSKKKMSNNRRKLLSFTPKNLPAGFVEFADKTEKQQQQILEKLGLQSATADGGSVNGGFAFSSSGGLQDKSSLQNQARRPDVDSTEGRWNSLPQKHKQEISHALTNTEFMPGFVRDVEQQIREFLFSWHRYHDTAIFNQKKKKQQQQEEEKEQKPEPYFDVLCRDGYGRLMVHILAQFYLLTSQSHDRPLVTEEETKSLANNNNTNNRSPPSSPNTPITPSSGRPTSNKANKAKNFHNNKKSTEVQRVTRVMINSQKTRPPPLPMNTLCSLFSLNETPSLTPQQQPSRNNNNNNGISPISPNETGGGSSFSIGTSAMVASSQQQQNTKKKNKQQSQPGHGSSSAASKTVSPVTPQEASSVPPAAASASTTKTASNRFGSLSQNTKRRSNNDDDGDASSSSYDSDDDDRNANNANQASSKKRLFKKKKSVVRRKILPLLQ